ncbi:glutamate synthase large subunit [Aliidiomarina haloalkalitolerans]|uniref:Glutamate synthase [NADPH] large chain n=1 Tax=Aliidiomarina haloalkalitolerans TaxID=859059 RepID=A0A432VR06_9GAMM|nr:glutamate synthase large subunit [Aliidiomarina haloalkalitolerans]MCL4409924.1 glutamate synthase large subunit [Gammaproteobacteria bacterium]RUO18701.1 glutamate synthase large subunit [Aliidiomarina haloalkalitolerans]
MSLYTAPTAANQVRDNCGFGLIAHLQGEASHTLLQRSITALDRMMHRGAIGADGKTGDGCGLLMQLPDSFFRTVAKENGWQLGKKYAVGQCFTSLDESLRAQEKQVLEEELQRETLTVHGWRKVPVDNQVLGEIAASTRPHIEQVFVSAQPGWRKKDLERRLYMARRRAEKRLSQHPDFYVVSLSCLVMVYKGLMMPKDLANFYKDLNDERLKTAICVFHQRFSTNTQPRWPLAQPFRFLAHNGEINTIAGNRQWAKARSYKMRSPLLPDLNDAAPFVGEQGSDSSSLDNMLELLLAGGMDLFRAMRLLIPPAWQGDPTMAPDLRAFYEFNSMHMEPWDGPAGVVLSNGRHVACSLDRNGLRPARYVITRDQHITVASEVGTWDYAPADVVEKGRLGPGEMLAVDTYNGKIWRSKQIDEDLQARHPYREWLDAHIRRLTPFSECEAELIGQRAFTDEQMAVFHKQFFYSREEINQVIQVLAIDGQEATGSMGDDTPVAVLSSQPRLLFDYFRQQFAQVTNPPIDPIRERHVMSLATCIGREQNMFNETSGYAHRVLFDSPVLMYTDLKQLKNLDDEHYKYRVFSLQFDPSIQSLEQALLALCDTVEAAVKEDGVVIVILSDRAISKNELPIPVAMATGAVQNRLVTKQLRCDANIIVETAAARDSHHIAVLVGLGATAVYPFLAYETIEQLCVADRGRNGVADRGRNALNIPVRQAVDNYRNGINKGLLKIMSKMGISCVASYRGAGLFELVGISDKIQSLCFPVCHKRIGGACFEDFTQDLQRLHKIAWLPRKPLNHGGLLKYVDGGEYHAYNPEVVTTLQRAVASRDTAAYLEFCRAVNNRPVAMLRDLLAVKAPAPVELHSSPGPQSLLKRFDTAAMSIGALSPEAHEALAIAMNKLGGHSNSGEGGEDPKRFGTLKNSRIKQVASGRFGVTPHYLVNADVLQIKIAQGAKPGEGGQLPGEKVTAEIAKLRYSVPGVTLISPPPHHDIYSIEDLAQLIFDLKQVNPEALVSVKLVSEPGIGTIATGVAKAYADLITVAGYDGGTGASPLTSVKYAGSPWELGLAEVHEALVINGLRHKVKLQVDGGLKTGLDIIKAAILGAESFGFGTAPMIALGCKYLRICHLNNCATGIATQDAALRQQYFSGLPEKVENYFYLLCAEVEHYLNELNVEDITDLIGRTDLLEKIAEPLTLKQEKIDLQPLLDSASVKSQKPLFNIEKNNPHDKGEKNRELLEMCHSAVVNRESREFSTTLRNDDRSVGATLSGFIAKTHGLQGLAGSPIKIYCTGTAGQSFGVWNAPGLHLYLTGDANDYVGKGMAGGRISIKPPAEATYASHESVIMGNTCLYGATGGRLYAAGIAGERFGVRNSGAIAVVEGIGDNGCEYMTGGVVVILGETGINFGAGMTGGMAYILDGNENFSEKINAELIEVLPIAKPILQEHLRGFIYEHMEHTGSERSRQILANFSEWLPKFRLVKPKARELEDLLGHRPRSTDSIRVEVM